MWKKVVALNLAIVLTLVILPIQEIVAFAESLDTGYAVFHRNDGSNEITNRDFPHFSSSGGLSLYRNAPKYETTDKRVVSYNSMSDGSGVSYKLTTPVRSVYSSDMSNPTKLYAMWEEAKDNSILYLSETGTTNDGKDYYLQSNLTQTATLAESTIFNEQNGMKVVGWESADSNDIYFPGDVIDITSNLTMTSITGINYFKIYYRNYSDSMYYENKITIEDEYDYSWYSNNLDGYARDINGKIFVGWNSKEDGSGEWITELNNNTPHNLYAQYELYPDGDTWVKIYSIDGLANGRKYGIVYADDSNNIVLPSILSNEKKVAFWRGRYTTYPAGEKIQLQQVKEELQAVTIDEHNQVGLIYGDGGKTKPYPSEYIGINYFMTSTGGMSLYSFDELNMFHKESNVFVGYKGNKTGKVYDYYSDVKTALSNEKDGDVSKFTAYYEPVEKGYIQYFGNGGLTSDGKGQYYEKMDFSNITSKTYAENKFIHSDGENFLGWSDSVDNPDAIYLSETNVQHIESAILYAQWGDNAVITHGTNFYGEKYVRFYKNVNTIDTLEYEDNYYNRKGYFKGWNTKADGSGEWYTCGDIVPEGAIIELYEQWEKAPGTGYYYVISKAKQQDGTQLKIIPMTAEKEIITIPKETNIKYWYSSENYDNIPWYGFADETEYIYSPGDELEVSSGTVISPFDPWVMVTYKENFGEDNNTRVQYHMSSHANLTTYSPQEIFSNISDDRVFVDWNTLPDGAGRSYLVGDYVGGKTTLYAQWFTENSVINGTCGDNITWKLTGDGTLTISGTGEMDNNSSWDEDRFWNYLKPYIKSVVIEEGVTYIGNYAFYECANLESVTIPKSINRIGYDAFYGCDKLKKVNINDIEAWCSIDFGWDREANPLSKCSEFYLNGVLTTDITIPSTVKSISNYAFYNCKWLEGISFEGDLSGVNWNTFDGCTNLKSIGVNKLETWINGARYFENCLTNNSWDLYIDGKLLEDLVIPESITWMNSNKTFYNCKSIKSVTFHDEFYQISDNMFANCINLSEINLSSSINTIGKNALYNTAFFNNESNWSDGMLCLGNHLVKVKENVSGEFSIPAKITSVAAGAFEGTEVTKVYIHSNVNNMQSAFTDAQCLTSVEIASGATYIPSRAFYNCSNLSEIIVPDSVYQIGQNAFNNTAYYNDEDNWENDSLYAGKVLVAHRGDGTGIYTVKDGIKSIASSAFMEKNYSSIILPESLIYIGDQAFYNCTNLTEMTLPENIDSLQWGLFYGCTSLKTVTLSEDIVGMSNQIFTDCTSLETIYNMPVKLNWYGTPIFTNCTSLKDIYCEGTSAQWQQQYGNKNLGIDMSNVTVHCAGDNRPADACGKELTWSLSNDGVLTISGSGKMYDFDENSTPWESVKEDVRELVVEEGVTKIGAYAFCHCPNLDTVRIPTTIKTMGDYAFSVSNNYTNISNVYIEDLASWCHIAFSSAMSNPLYNNGKLNLNNKIVTELVIPEGVSEIGRAAFWGCSSIETITLPKTVTNSYNYWFNRCKNLNQIIVATENPVYRSQNGVLFSKDMSQMYQYPPNSMNAQYDVPEGVSKINYQTFSYCNRLQKISLPNGVSVIDNWAMYNCTSLKEITLPITVTIIRQGAFSGCTALTTVNYSGNDADWNTITIEKENEPLINAISNTSTARTKTTISSDGKTFTITPINIENGKTVILALYDGDKFVEMQKEVYAGVDIAFTTTKSYTNAKVMVWDNLTNLKPVCNVEIVK